MPEVFHASAEKQQNSRNRLAMPGQLLAENGGRLQGSRVRNVSAVKWLWLGSRQGVGGFAGSDVVLRFRGDLPHVPPRIRQLTWKPIPRVSHRGHASTSLIAAFVSSEGWHVEQYAEASSD
jgi:hypothetical protein